MKKILVVNVNWLGDVIFSSPVFYALKKHYPQASISCLAVGRVQSVLEGIDVIDEIIILDEEKKHKGLFGKLKLVSELRSKKFDVVFLLHRSVTRALLVWLAQIPERVGYGEKKRAKLLTHCVPPLNIFQVHRSDYYLNVIESFGVPVNDRLNKICVDQSSKERIEHILKENKISRDQYKVVINAGGNWDLKRWPAHQFSLLIKYLSSKEGVCVIVAGAESDKGLVDSIVKPLSKKPIILTGCLNLKELIALASEADVFISSDSGPLHLANAVGTDVIGIFGPTRPELTGPRGSGKVSILHNEIGCNKKACYFLECPDNVCMQSVTVKDVCNEFEQIRN